MREIKEPSVLSFAKQPAILFLVFKVTFEVETNVMNLKLTIMSLSIDKNPPWVIETGWTLDERVIRRRASP